MFQFFESRIDPYPEQQPTEPPERLVAFCWLYTKPVAGWVVVMMFLTAFVAIGEVALFGFLGSIVDWLSNADRVGFLEREGRLLWSMGAFLLIALPLAVLFHSLIVHQALLGNYPMIARWQMHRYLLKQSMAFFVNEFAGRVATRVMQTSLAVRDVVMKVADVLVYVLVYFIAVVVMVASSDLRLAAPLLIWLVIYVAIVSYFVPKLAVVSRQQADARSMMTGRIVDSYTNINTVKLFSHAGREADYARSGMQHFLQTVYRQMRFVTSMEFWVYFNNALVVFLIAGLSIWLWLESVVSVGSIAVAVALALRLNGMSQWIMWEMAGLFESIGIVHDGMTMLSKRRAVFDQPGAPELVVQKGNIRFEDVTFHYGKASGVIDGLNFEVQPGERVGLVGRSGAGKTTIANILLRFYDLESGKILIDGVDIATVTQDSLRSQIGVVTQDTSLLHRSIRDNIAYSKPGASDAEVIEAAKRAKAWEFIEELEDQEGRKGCDAFVGERGVRLSGGQRQRIAIARVFLKDAPILVLDEATSALDSEVEAAIQENLFELMSGKTVIAIAHRLSTIASLDRLVVVEEGQIIETGTHNELIDANGVYADLWMRQSGGFLGDDL